MTSPFDPTPTDPTPTDPTPTDPAATGSAATGSAPSDPTPPELGSADAGPGSAPPQPPSRARPRRLSRSTDDRVVGGVCGGLAAYTGIDASVIRIITVVFMLMGHGVLLYAAAWLLLPVGDEEPSAFDRYRARRHERRAPKPTWQGGAAAA